MENLNKAFIIRSNNVVGMPSANPQIDDSGVSEKKAWSSQKTSEYVDGKIDDTTTDTSSTWSSSKIASELGRTQISHVGTDTGWKAEKDLSSYPIGTYRLTAMHSSSGGVLDALILKTGYSYQIKTVFKEAAHLDASISGDILTVTESTTSIGVISVFLNTVGVNA